MHASSALVKKVKKLERRGVPTLDSETVGELETSISVHPLKAQRRQKYAGASDTPQCAKNSVEFSLLDVALGWALFHVKCVF